MKVKSLQKTIKQYDDVKKIYFSATPSEEHDEENLIIDYTYLNGVNDKILQPFDIYLQIALSDEDPENNEQDESKIALKMFRMVRNFIETKNNKVMSFHNGVNESNQNQSYLSNPFEV